MKVQTKYMQTILNDFTGELLYYRVTFPISKEFANSGIVKKEFINQVRNKYFYVNQSNNFQDLERAVKKLQIKVAEHSIVQLKLKILNKQLELFL